MKRRRFLSIPLLGAILPLAGCIQKRDPWLVIESVQEQLFPHNGNYPSAKDFEATRYLKLVSQDASFEKEDLDFILRGAKELQALGYRLKMSAAKQHALLKQFEQTTLGENWLSIMITYTLEALFADPIYGGNKNEIGWKSYHHHPGIPRPTKRFGVKDV